MSLEAQCPRCAAVPVPTSGSSPDWSCPMHGPVIPLWRATVPSYDAFADFLGRCRPLPIWLPWPVPPGWHVTDFGCVAGDQRDRAGGDGGASGASGAGAGGARAVVTACTGATDLDGVVELAVVTEEPGVGLGARCAGVAHTDPGAAVDGPPAVRIRTDGGSVPLWALPLGEVGTSDGPVLDRSVLVGEAEGRWLWLVLRPASAALLLQGRWELHDVSALGPQLIALPFAEVPRAW